MTDVVADTGSAALPYHEPDITTILILASFLLSLNLVNHLLDRLIYCGLLGQIFLGILWGTPGAKWLDRSAEQFIVNAGYLGLILLVYEGGLATSFKSLRANLLLSVGIALTGICLPLGFSYVLLSLVDATPLQAFAAGAALCSTSLGTTFTVLGTSGLITTRMGVLLATAAMMDDVVGLVMVQVISNLGASSSSFDAITVVRPVFVSLAFAIVVPVFVRAVVQPFTYWFNSRRTANTPKWLAMVLNSIHFAMVLHTFILIGLVTGSSYAGTSNLFAAYLAGASISWWDAELEHPLTSTPNSIQNRDDHYVEPTTGEAVFARFYQPALTRILRPLFFASIGFSIPITQMFSGTVVWKGIVYTVLMTIGKAACGMWLIRTSLRLPNLFSKSSDMGDKAGQQVVKSENSRVPLQSSKSDNNAILPSSTKDEQSKTSPVVPPERIISGEIVKPRSSSRISNTSRRLCAKTSPDHPHNVKSAAKPVSLYPAAIVASAMTARGEIGFLISSLAESNGIFRQQRPNSTQPGEQDEIFLIVTWAIVLCTILGPVAVGLIVRRMSRLQNSACASGRSRSDVLGVWN